MHIAAYLESDIYPNSIFEGKVLDTHIKEMGNARVEGDLTIHGIKNKIFVEGFFLEIFLTLLRNSFFGIKFLEPSILITPISLCSFINSSNYEKLLYEKAC